MNGTTSQTDWIGLIMTSNEAALQWAQLFTGRRLPEDEAVSVTTGDGETRLGLSNMGGLVVLGAIVLVAVLVLRK